MTERTRQPASTQHSNLQSAEVGLEKNPQLKGLQQTLVAMDGTLLPALPKMLWALWIDDQHRAAKLHLELDLLKSVPLQAEVTEGNGNEKTILRGVLSANKLYLLDAGYSEYKLFQEILNVQSSFVARVRENAVWETLAERSLTEEDKRAGVQKDLVVRLGCKGKQDDLGRPVRVIEVFHKGESSRPRRARVSSKKTFRTTAADYTLLLVTDRMDLSAEIIALLYRYRPAACGNRTLLPLVQIYPGLHPSDLALAEWGLASGILRPDRQYAHYPLDWL